MSPILIKPEFKDKIDPCYADQGIFPNAQMVSMAKFIAYMHCKLKENITAQ